MTRVVIGSGTLKYAKADQRRLCGTEPKALARSKNTTWRFVPSFLAVWIWCQMTLACSTHPEKPDMPAFWIEVSIRLFFRRHPANLCAATLKKIFPSTFRRLIWRNWPISDESFSFGIRIPPALRHEVGTSFLCHTVLISFQRKRRTSGAFLYSLYGIPLGPGS